jgi:hypothetical protein
MKLTAEIVNKTFMECLFKEGEPTEEHVRAEGLVNFVGFHPNRLKEATPVIEELLQEVPESFNKSGGGGMSFINLAQDKDGNQWADLHQTMEQLVLLGIGIGKVKYLMPRVMWPALPGGAPYIVVNN